jgi:hypothetical protein
MSTFISGVANPNTEPHGDTGVHDSKPTFIPPPPQHTGIFGPPGYAKKGDDGLLFGIKPNKPVRQKGTKNKGAKASAN